MNDIGHSTVAFLGLVLGALTLAVGVVGGCIKFLWNRTTEIDGRVTAVNGELRNAMTVQMGDHRLETSNLWAEVRRMNDVGHVEHIAMIDAMGKQHAALLEMISKLATREEMERTTHAMETRIMDTLRKEVPQR